MRVAYRLKIIASVFAVLGGFLLNSGLSQAAGSASFSLAVTSGSFTKGSKVTLALYENSGSTGTNAVQANIGYDNSKLEIVHQSGGRDADFTGSSFGIVAEAKEANGHIRIGAGVTPSGGTGATVTGKQLVAKIIFTVKSGSGSTSFNFESGTNIVDPSDGSNIWNGNTAGGTFGLKSPPGSGGSSKPPSSGGSTSKPKTPTPATTPTITPTEEKKQKANPTEPVIASLNPTEVGSTYIVAIKVLDNDGKPVNNATVSLGGSSSQTDDTGIAGFVGIAAGTYDVEAKAGNKVLGKSTITVDGNKVASDVQQFEIKAKKKLNWTLYAGIGALILAIIVIIGLLRGGISGHKRRQASKHHGLDSPPPSQPTGGSQVTPVAPTPVSGGQPTPPAPTVVSGGSTPAPKTTASDDNLIKPTVITPSGSDSTS